MMNRVIPLMIVQGIMLIRIQERMTPRKAPFITRDIYALMTDAVGLESAAELVKNILLIVKNSLFRELAAEARA